MLEGDRMLPLLYLSMRGGNCLRIQNVCVSAWNSLLTESVQDLISVLKRERDAAEEEYGVLVDLPTEVKCTLDEAYSAFNRRHRQLHTAKWKVFIREWHLAQEAKDASHVVNGAAKISAVQDVAVEGMGEEDVSLAGGEMQDAEDVVSELSMLLIMLLMNVG